MSKDDILEILQEIMQNIFDDDSLVINYKTSRTDISDWDSLSHIRIILSVEKRFNIKMDVDKSVLIDNVGDFVDIIEQEINKESV